MKLFLFAFAIISIAVILLSLGLILGKKRKLKRSCEERGELMARFARNEKCSSCDCSR